jgi:hypothetical protein
VLLDSARVSHGSALPKIRRHRLATSAHASDGRRSRLVYAETGAPPREVSTRERRWDVAPRVRGTGRDARRLAKSAHASDAERPRLVYTKHDARLAKSAHASDGGVETHAAHSSIRTGHFHGAVPRSIDVETGKKCAIRLDRFPRHSSAKPRMRAGMSIVFAETAARPFFAGKTSRVAIARVNVAQ